MKKLLCIILMTFFAQNLLAKEEEFSAEEYTAKIQPIEIYIY